MPRRYGPLSDQQKAQISAAQLGRHRSDEARAKMSAFQRGRTKSPEHRAKIAASNRGKHSYLAEVNRRTWDAQPAEERLARLASARAALTPEVRARQSQTMKLSVRSLEALARMHAARRAEPPQSPERRAAMSASCKASPKVQANIKRATAAAARAKPSSIELTIRAVLDGVGVPYFPAYPIGPYAADIYVPSHRLVIECDGTYWHRNSAEKDKARDMYMIGLGYSVLRLPEQDIRAGAATPRVLHAIGRAA